MKHNRLFFAFALVASLGFTAGCDDPFNAEENFRMNKDQVISRPQYAEGLLDYAYTQMPYRSFRFDEVATDDLSPTRHPIPTASWLAEAGARYRTPRICGLSATEA